MADARNRDHLNWLRQVAFDPSLTAFAVRVAVGLTEYFNRETGYAFMSQETLSNDLSAKGVDGIRKAVLQLETAGHLEVRRSAGRVVNLYRPLVKPQTLRGAKSRDKPDGQRGLGRRVGQITGGENPDSRLKQPPTARPVEPLEGKPPEEPLESVSGALPFCLEAQPPAVADLHGSDFDQFWNAYPRRVGKKKALEAYARARKAGNSAQLLLTAATAYAGERAGKDPTYTKHPASWLNGEHWADEPASQWSPDPPRQRQRTAMDWALEGADE